MSEHTKAPWRVQRYVGRDEFQIHAWSDAEHHKYWPVRLPIAWIPNGWYRGNGRLHNELEANANLIAAAPTMYSYIASSASNGCAEAKKILAALAAGGQG